MNFDELVYNPDMDFDIAKEPASIEQRQFLATMWDSNMQNAIPEKQRILIDIQLNNMDELSWVEANDIIQKIIDAQPTEPMSMTQTELAKWIKKNKL